MNSLQKLGGAAALYQAGAYLVAIVFFLFIVDYPSITDPLQKVTLLVENQAGMYFMHLFVYVVFGIFLVILSLALHERLKAGSPAMSQTATAFGLIWAGLLIASGMVHNIGLSTVAGLYAQDPAQAASYWLTAETVQAGLGGEYEIVGGLWVFLISWAALRADELPRALNYLGMLVGVVGLLSAVPGLLMLNGVFGLSQIVWFIWLGIILLRGKALQTKVAKSEMRSPR